MQDLTHREFNPLKILHHLDRLRALAEGRDVAPVTVEIDPVSWCNHRCGWCVDPEHHPGSMPVETFDALTRELQDFRVDGLGVEGIVLKGGGEPTLHERFGDLLQLSVDRGFSVGVVTNGSRLQRWREALLRAAYVRVSLDGPTPESHAAVHGSKDFLSIVTGLRALVEARGGERYPVLGASFALDLRGAALAEEAITLGAELGLDYVLLRPPFFEEVGRAPTMSPAEAAEARRRMREAAARYAGPMLVQVGSWVGDAERAAGAGQELEVAGRRDLQARGLPVEHRTGRCLASPLLAVVTADGTLYGCCNLRALPAWSMGRLNYPRGVGFAQLWAGAERAGALARMHRTECIRHCTHPLERYNEMIEVLRQTERGHRGFV